MSENNSLGEEVKEHIQTALKYVVLSVAVGILVGIVDAIFGHGLAMMIGIRTRFFKFLLPLLPIGGLIIVFLYDRFSHLSRKGMSLVFEAGQDRRKFIPRNLVPLAMISAWITHLFGASAGREGVAVQIGATISFRIGRRLKLPHNARVLLVAGMAAGFGGLFQTPIAGMFFAMEVIVAGIMDYRSLMAAFIAAHVASLTSHMLGINKYSVDLANTPGFTTDIPFVKLIILGVVFGITGLAFSFLMSKVKTITSKAIGNRYKRIAIFAIPLAVLLFVLHQGRYCGLGDTLIEACFLGEEILPYDFILKMLLTVFTLAIGFQGGELTPLFSIGTTLGFVLGGIMGLPPLMTAALGYAAVFGSATNTLFAPIFIGYEVFGGDGLGSFIIVCVIAYMMNGNISIYSAQQTLSDFLERTKKMH